MNPHLIFSAAKVAYKNREVAAKLLSKVKDWRSADEVVPEERAVALPLEERLDRLEGLSRSQETLIEAQSELIVGLAGNVAELSTTTQALLARAKLLTWMIIISLGLSIVALVFALG